MVSHRSCLLVGSSNGGKDRWALWGLFYQIANHIHKGSSSMAKLPTTGSHFLWSSPWPFGFQLITCGEIWVFRPCSTPAGPSENWEVVLEGLPALLTCVPSSSLRCGFSVASPDLSFLFFCFSLQAGGHRKQMGDDPTGLIIGRLQLFLYEKEFGHIEGLRRVAGWNTSWTSKKLWACMCVFARMCMHVCVHMHEFLAMHA